MLQRRASALMPFVAAQFAVTLGLFGGASRWDALSQLPVRISALVVIGYCVLVLPQALPKAVRIPLIGIGLLATAISVQLIPLPAQLWFALPGHEGLRPALASVGLVEAWRPINLTPDRGLNALLSLLPPIAAALCVARLGFAEASKVVAAVVICGLISGLLGVAQLAAGSSSALRYYEITNRDAAVGLFANRNHQALFLAATLPFASVLAQGLSLLRRTHLGLIVAVAAYGLFIVLLILATGSRAGLIWAAISFAVAMSIVVKATGGVSRPMRNARGWLVGGAIVMLGAIAGIMIAAPDRLASLTRFNAQAFDTDTRLANLPVLIDMAKAFFPTGSGFGSFAVAYQRFEPDQLLNLTYLNQAHDDFLQIVIEGGALALILVALTLLLIGRRVMQAAFSGNHLRYAAAAGVVMCLAASLIDYPMRTPLIACLLMVCCIWLEDAGEWRDRRGRVGAQNVSPSMS